MPDETEALLELANEYLSAAQANRAAGRGRLRVAYDEAHHAAELAAKALLLHKRGEYPRRHALGGPLAAAGLVPISIDRRKLARFLEHHTRAAYGHMEEFTAEEVGGAIWMAEAMVQAATAWPGGSFHPAVEPV